MKIDAIDLFCGAGGLSFGLQKAGIFVRAGLDLDPECDYPYSENIVGAKFLLEDIASIKGEALANLYRPKSLKLLAGCAPCQPFSNLRNGTAREKSDKWPLLNHFSRLIQEISPDLVTMENVPNLKGQSIFESFIKALSVFGYHIEYRVVNAADYGVPQRRKRLVLLASRLGSIHLLAPQEIQAARKTVREAIGGLCPLNAGETSTTDPLHKARGFAKITLQRIRASKPGGTWEDWPEHLRLDCHKRASGATYKSVYGRLEWDKPSGTITTQASNFGTGRFGHPQQDRSLSLREMAILQSFPPDYKFLPQGATACFTPLSRLIGNAVPVDLGYAVGMSIMKHVKNYRSANGKSK